MLEHKLKKMSAFMYVLRSKLYTWAQHDYIRAALKIERLPKLGSMTETAVTFLNQEKSLSKCQTFCRDPNGHYQPCKQMNRWVVLARNGQLKHNMCKLLDRAIPIVHTRNFSDFYRIGGAVSPTVRPWELKGVTISCYSNCNGRVKIWWVTPRNFRIHIDQ